MLLQARPSGPERSTPPGERSATLAPTRTSIGVDMKRLCLTLLLIAAGAIAPASADERALNLKIGDAARRDREATLVVDGITDTARGDVISPPELAARLDDVQARVRGREPHRRRVPPRPAPRDPGAATARTTGAGGPRDVPGDGGRAGVARPLARRPGPGRAGVRAGVALVQELGLSLELLPGHLRVRPRQRHPPVRRERAARGGADGAQPRASTRSRPSSARSCPRAWTRTAPSTSSCSGRSSARPTRSTATCPTRCSRGCTARSAPGTPRWGGTRSRRCASTAATRRSWWCSSAPATSPTASAPSARHGCGSTGGRRR